MFFYRYQPNAQYHLTDIAEQMLDIAKERFKGLENFTFSARNYSSDYDFEGFDTVISALSIHHLEDSDKQKLFSNIYRALPLGEFLQILTSSVQTICLCLKPTIRSGYLILRKVLLLQMILQSGGIERNLIENAVCRLRSK